MTLRNIYPITPTRTTQTYADILNKAVQKQTVWNDKTVASVDINRHLFLSWNGMIFASNTPKVAAYDKVDCIYALFCILFG